jgi:hypothetical protein
LLSRRWHHRRVRSRAARPIENLTHDSLSEYTFPAGACATIFGVRFDTMLDADGGAKVARNAMLFISLMDSGRIECAPSRPASCSGQALASKLPALRRLRAGPAASVIVLGIESSCDETAAALVRDDGVVLSDVVASQIELHAPYGGVVPELAARAHMEHIVPVLQRALEVVPGGLSGVDGMVNPLALENAWRSGSS